MNAATRAVIERLIAEIEFIDTHYSTVPTSAFDAIAEARALLAEPASEDAWLADVRKKARDDALEEAKTALNDERVDGTVSSEDAAYNTAIDHCIGALAALKDQPSGEQP